MLKILWALFLPGGLIFIAAIGFLRPYGLPLWCQGPVAALPYIVLTFGLVFGWYLSSSRLILSLLMLALADRALFLFPPIDSDPSSMGHTLFAAVSLLLPLNLLALSLIKEEALSTLRGVVRLLLLLVQPFFVLWLALPDQAELAGSLQQPLIPMDSPARSGLAQPALLAFLGAILLIGIRFAVDQNPLDAGTLWAVLGSFIAFHGLRYGWSPTNFLSAAGLIVFVTLVQASHQSVYRDALTGLNSTLAYDEAAAMLGSKYVVAIVGLDQLKHYANQHGKRVGELVLRQVAPKIQAAAGSAQVYRLGGDELTVLFSRKTTTETLVTLEAIRKAVEQCRLELRGRETVREVRGASRPRPNIETLTLTASIGVAEAGDAQASLGLVTKAAYRALYEAKGEGGNVIKRGQAVAAPTKAAPAGTGRIVAYSDY